MDRIGFIGLGVMGRPMASNLARKGPAPRFTIDLAHQDLTLIVDAARAAKVPMPIGATALESFSAARAQGEGMKDFSAMVDILCDSAHIDRPRLQ